MACGQPLAATGIRKISAFDPDGVTENSEDTVIASSRCIGYFQAPRIRGAWQRSTGHAPAFSCFLAAFGSTKRILEPRPCTLRTSIARLAKIYNRRSHPVKLAGRLMGVFFCGVLDQRKTLRSEKILKSVALGLVGGLHPQLRRGCLQRRPRE